MNCMIKAANISVSNFILQIQMEWHAATRESAVKGVCHAAAINCRCGSGNINYGKLCICLAFKSCHFYWVLTGYLFYPGGREPYQRCPVSNNCGNDQEGMASKLARYVKRDGCSNSPRGE